MDRILIIHRGSLGDFLLLVPTVAMLRQKFPHSALEAIGRPEIISLVQPGLIDAAVSADSSIFLPVFENFDDIPAQAIQFLSRFDAVFAFVRDPEGALERSLARVGIKHVLVRPPFPPEGEGVHVAQYQHESLSFYLNEKAPPENRAAHNFSAFNLFCFSNEETRRAERFLERLNPSGGAPIAIHPGSGSQRKCWPFERFGELGRLLVENGRRSLVWILGPADSRLAQKVHWLARELDAQVAESMPLRDLAAVLSRCAAYVGNDSGVTHLAALAGTPTVAVFGPTDPEMWAPVGKTVKIVRGRVACSPCARSKMIHCGRRICLEDVTVRTVLDMFQDSSVR